MNVILYDYPNGDLLLCNRCKLCVDKTNLKGVVNITDLKFKFFLITCPECKNSSYGDKILNKCLYWNLFSFEICI